MARIDLVDRFAALKLMRSVKPYKCANSVHVWRGDGLVVVDWRSSDGLKKLKQVLEETNLLASVSDMRLVDLSAADVQNLDHNFRLPAASNGRISVTLLEVSDAGVH